MTAPAEQQPSPVASTGIKSDLVSGLVLVALAGYILWLNRKFPVGSLADPGPGYVPMLLAIGLGLVGLLVAILGGRSRPLAAIRWPEGTRAVIILVACTAGRTRTGVHRLPPDDIRLSGVLHRRD